MDTKIKAKILPYDFTDLLVVSIVITVWIGSWLLISASWCLVDIRLGVTVFFAGYLAMGFSCCFVVSSISVDTDGIKLVRMLWKSKRILWSDIYSIEEVSRKEILFYGWLTFPPRSYMLGLCAKGHFRIVWNNGLWYFPPRNIEEFRRIITEYAPNVLR